MLQAHDDRPWPLTMSADCLRFVGRYRRVEGFRIDPMLLFEAIGRPG